MLATVCKTVKFRVRIPLSPPKFMKWQEGRQKTGYLNKKLFESTRFSFDLYLLKFPENSYIPKHQDAVSSGKHYRVNLILKEAEGGEFKCKNTILNWRFLKIFRPDINEHEVTKVTKGTRYVLSFGFVKQG